MDHNLRTLSISSWMSLPGELDFNTWMAKRALDGNKENQTELETKTKPVAHNKNNEFTWWRCFSNLQNQNAKRQSVCEKIEAKHQPKIEIMDFEAKLSNTNQIHTELVKTPVPRRELSVRRQVSREVQTRALVSDVAEYYESFVHEMNLERFFHNNTLVTCVKPISRPAKKNCRWLVRGIQGNGTHFAYICRNVVLANGASDLANQLGVSGEASNDWIKHDLPALVSALEQTSDEDHSSMLKIVFACLLAVFFIHF